MSDARDTLRRCFDRWNTRPDQIQTDGEGSLVNSTKGALPSTFTLWLKGLDIEHIITRPGTPTDNAEVERCHRTINDYAIVGNEKRPIKELQSVLDDAVLELAIDLPSRAEGCAGRSPLEAHPDLLESVHPYRIERELMLFDLQRVDAFLSTFIWTRKVGKMGQINLGGQNERYSVGRAYAGHHVTVRFDPADRHFVFFLPAPQHDDADHETLLEIGRRPARALEVEDLTGLYPWPDGPVPQQLPLPYCSVEG